MKTAEEWYAQWKSDPNAKSREVIKQIQLNAYRAGGLVAAEIAKPTCGIADCGHQTCAGRKLANQNILDYFNNHKLEIPESNDIYESLIVDEEFNGR